MIGLINRKAAKEKFNDIPPFIGMTGGCVQKMLDDVPTADAVEIKTLEAWLYEIAMNNTQSTLGGACEEIIHRLNGLRTFAKEKSEESASCDIPGEPILCEICSQWNAGNGWCKKHNKYTRADWHCAGGGA